MPMLKEGGIGNRADCGFFTVFMLWINLVDFAVPKNVMDGMDAFFQSCFISSYAAPFQMFQMFQRSTTLIDCFVEIPRVQAMQCGIFW